MKSDSRISSQALSVWSVISKKPFSLSSQAALENLKTANYTDYCVVLGLVFRVAVYQNNELPDNVRGANPEAFVITTEAPMRAPMVEDVLDHDEAWRLAVETLSLEEAYGIGCPQ